MSLTCFQVTRSVLDTTYNEVPEIDGQRDANIKAAIELMSKTYRKTLVKSGGPDFSNPATRFGYVLTYVPAHAHWVYELIQRYPETRALFDKPKLRVACLGGGPGSDIVGILKYIEKAEKNTKIFCEIIDGCIEWKATWSDVIFSLDCENSLHTDYVIHNLEDPFSWRTPSQIGKADLVTLSFFVSEVFHIAEQAETYLKNAFAALKPGALVLLNDNNVPTFYEWIDGIASTAGLKTLRTGVGTCKIYDVEEQMSDLGEYMEKFDRRPKLTGDLCWRVYQKP